VAADNEPCPLTGQSSFDHANNFTFASTPAAVNINTDKWFIWYSSLWLDWNNNQYNAIKSIQYYARPRLIVMSQAIWDKRIPKFSSSGWDVFKNLKRGADGLSLMSLVLPAADSASRMLRAAHCTGRTAQSAERAATRACLVQRVLMSYSSRCPRILFSSPAAVRTPGTSTVLPWGSNATQDTHI